MAFEGPSVARLLGIRGSSDIGHLRERLHAVNALEPDLVPLDDSALLGEATARAVEKRLTLLAIDRCWSEHLADARGIHHGIHVVRFVGKTPLSEYWREMAAAFDDLRERIDEEIVRSFEGLKLGSDGVDWDSADLRGPSSTWTYLVNDNPFGANVLMDLANRTGFALWGAILWGPLLFAYGLYLHWKRRRRARVDAKL